MSAAVALVELVRAGAVQAAVGHPVVLTLAEVERSDNGQTSDVGVGAEPAQHLRLALGVAVRGGVHVQNTLPKATATKLSKDRPIGQRREDADHQVSRGLRLRALP